MEAEKVYCRDSSADALAYAALTNTRDRNDYMNNPMWLIWAMVFGGGNGFFNNRNNYGCEHTELNSRLNSIERQAQDNHNNELLMQSMQGNHAALHELAGALNVSTSQLADRICGVQSTLAKAAGDLGISIERVLNGVIIGDKDITAAVKDCCCNTQQNILKMGYENQLGQKDIINEMQKDTTALGFQVGERLTGIANGMTKGFADLGYVGQQNKCDIVNAINAAQQRTADLLNNHWTLEISQRLQDTKAELSQERQSAYLISQLRATAAPATA